MLIFCWAVCCLTEATIVFDVASLQAAVEATGGPSTIVVSPGLYLLDRAILVNRRVTVSASAPNTVRLSGNGSTRIFELYLKGDLTLANVTLEDGRGENATSLATAAPYSAPAGGGCIAVYTRSSSAFGTSSALTLLSVILTRCVTTTGNGGAIMLYMPSLSSFTCTDCVFRENIANSSNTEFGYGGAVYYNIYSDPSEFGLKMRFDTSWFDSNSARTGGAVHIQSPAGELRFNLCNFTNNSAIAKGGALSMAEDVAASAVLFEGNSAGSLLGNAIEMTNALCTFTRDVETSFVQNGGFDGPIVKAVIDATNAGQQLRVVSFTPAPTPPPFPPVSFPPTSPPVPTVPTVPQPAPTAQPAAPSSSSGPNFSTIALAVVLGLFFLSMLALVVVVRQRRENLRRTIAQRAAEQEHNAFAHRRTNKPKVVTFTELLPEDLADNPCIICHGEAVVDKTTVSRCIGTISAGKYKLTTQSLSTAFARLECGHVFHAACLIMWTEVSGNTTCPECRIVIASEDKRRNSSMSSSGSSKSGSRLRQSRSAPALNVLTTSAATLNPRPRQPHEEDDEVNGDTVAEGNLPFSHIARRSHNADDLHVENAVLVRELHTVRQRSDERRIPAPSVTSITSTTLANSVL